MSQPPYPYYGSNGHLPSPFSSQFQVPPPTISYAPHHSLPPPSPHHSIAPPSPHPSHIASTHLPPPSPHPSVSHPQQLLHHSNASPSLVHAQSYPAPAPEPYPLSQQTYQSHQAYPYPPTPSYTSQNAYPSPQYQPQPTPHVIPSLHHQPSLSRPPQPSQRLLQTAEVRLEIRCKGLRDMDITSKSDPICVVSVERKGAFGGGGEPGDYGAAGIQWREEGRTECIKNCLSPHFKTQVSVPYRFEELQHIKLSMYDIDSKRPELTRHDFLGEVRTTLGELVSARVWTAKLGSPNERDTKGFLGGRRDLGTITVIVHENQDGGNLLIKATIKGTKLDRKDLFPPSSDPYFIVSQIEESPSSRSRLYVSEVVPRNLNPMWKPCQFKAVIPKGGDKRHVMLEFVVNDKDRHKRDDEIGIAKVSVSDLEENQTLQLINAKKKKNRRKYKNSGTLELCNFRAFSMPSMVDYLQGGLRLHFSVAIDLTASNRPPTDPTSLHYRADMYSSNHYIHALTSIENVLRVYMPTDNHYTAFGFGAELPGNPGVTNSCFPLGLGHDASCIGINGVLQAYNTALQRVRFSGPTYFAPLIDAVYQYSKNRPRTQTDQNYDVLLILTDGVVSDFSQTVDRIITASQSSLSIIIIGIGDRRDFSKMKDLDSDDAPLRSCDGTRQAARDIVQFVAFSEFEHAPPERLGAAVLQELPGNIVEYFIGQCDPPIMPGQRPVIPNF